MVFQDSVKIKLSITYPPEKNNSDDTVGGDFFSLLSTHCCKAA